ncbi:CLUMA_CG005845, isoform A [Clunio marinus]|uniref:CLUMA_CG005845, isoform A n=1 Tax=Clunio marinus TaxID=568069 RepID=A0A1J1HXH9_9DIPT|nr:CLUMA_CG005845, isoform A [Clunio marinus]
MISMPKNHCNQSHSQPASHYENLPIHNISSRKTRRKNSPNDHLQQQQQQKNKRNISIVREWKSAKHSYTNGYKQSPIAKTKRA